VRAVVASTDAQQRLQRQQNDVTSTSSSSHCLQTVVIVTASLFVAVLLTLAVVMTTLYAARRRRRRHRMTSSPPFPLPVSTGCRCGGGATVRRSWMVGCSGAHLPPSDDSRSKSVQRQHHHGGRLHQQLVNCADLTSPDARYDDARRPAVITPSPNDQPLKPTSESTLLLVARDAWTS